MINKNIKRILLGGLVLSAITFTSCNKQDNDVFGKLPSEREQEQANKLKDILVSAPQGWKLLYFTDDTELGGFSFLMKFNSNGKVTMLGDFDEESYTEQVSEYEIQLRGTTSLVFVTQNKIHKLADPFNSPTTGNKGYKGDFQFRYYENDENEITFRATTDIKQVIKLVKATPEDWNQFEGRKALVENFSSYEIPVFRQIIVNENGTETIYDGTYTGVTRFMSSMNDASAIGISKGIGIGFTNHGAVISPAIDIKGEKFSNFEWNETQNAFVDTNTGDVSVRIQNAAVPNEWPDDYKSIAFSRDRVGGLSRKTLPIISSASNTQPFFDAIVKDNEVIYDDMWVFFQNGNLTINYDLGSTRYTYTARLVDSNGKGKLLMQNGRWSTPNAPEEVKTMHDKLFGSGSLFLKRQTYKVGASNEIMTIYSGGSAVVFDTYMV